MDQPEIRISPEKGKSLNLSQIWQYRELIYYFAWRDIKVKYNQTVLGILWVVLQPLLLMSIFYVVFFKSFNVHVEFSYPVYAFAGLILWLLFSAGITNSCDNLINSAQLIRKIYFPRLIIPLASFATGLIDFLICLLLMFVLVLALGQPISIHALYCFPLAITIVFISSFGIGSLLSALSIKYRDFRYAIPFGMQLLFFTSQVVYSIAHINKLWMTNLLYCNPLNGALELFYFPMRNSPANLAGISISLFSAVFFFVTGLFYFKKTETYFADII